MFGNVEMASITQATAINETGVYYIRPNSGLMKVFLMLFVMSFVTTNCLLTFTNLKSFCLLEQNGFLSRRLFK